MEGHGNGSGSCLLTHTGAIHPEPGGVIDIRGCNHICTVAGKRDRIIFPAHAKIPGGGQLNVVDCGITPVCIALQLFAGHCIGQPLGGKTGVQFFHQRGADGVCIFFRHRRNSHFITLIQHNRPLVSADVVGQLKRKRSSQRDLLCRLSRFDNTDIRRKQLIGRRLSFAADGNHIFIGRFPGNQRPDLPIHRTGKREIPGDGRSRISLCQNAFQGDLIQNFLFHGRFHFLRIPVEEHGDRAKGKLCAVFFQQKRHLTAAEMNCRRSVGVHVKISDVAVFRNACAAILFNDRLHGNLDAVKAFRFQIALQHFVEIDVLAVNRIEFVPFSQRRRSLLEHRLPVRIHRRLGPDNNGKRLGLCFPSIGQRRRQRDGFFALVRQGHRAIGGNDKRVAAFPCDGRAIFAPLRQSQLCIVRPQLFRKRQRIPVGGENTVRFFGNLNGPRRRFLLAVVDTFEIQIIPHQILRDNQRPRRRFQRYELVVVQIILLFQIIPLHLNLGELVIVVFFPAQRVDLCPNRLAGRHGSCNLHGGDKGHHCKFYLIRIVSRRGPDGRFARLQRLNDAHIVRRARILHLAQRDNAFAADQLPGNRGFFLHIFVCDSQRARRLVAAVGIIQHSGAGDLYGRLLLHRPCPRLPGQNGPAAVDVAAVGSKSGTQFFRQPIGAGNLRAICDGSCARSGGRVLVIAVGQAGGCI